ncbi:MAG TPA: hypothetical protein VKB34_09240 [Povalibacter sp.]|nr:hypothetical protein [Povalibacter sp.]
MKLRYALALPVLLLSTMACAGEDGVLFKVVLLKDEHVVTSPWVMGEFGQQVTVEMSQTMKFVGVASAPDGEGHSLMTVTLSLFIDGAMQPGKEMSMLADLSKTPSIEYTVPGTAYHFVVTPTQVKLPGSG